MRVSLRDLQRSLEEIRDELKIVIDPDEVLKDLIMKSINAQIFKALELTLLQLSLRQKIDLIAELDKKNIPKRSDPNHH